MREIKGRKVGEALEADKKDRYFPNLYMELSDLPEAKAWEVGEEYTVTLKLRMTSVHQDERGPKDGSVGFDVIGIDAGESEGEEKVSRKEARADEVETPDEDEE